MTQPIVYGAAPAPTRAIAVRGRAGQSQTERRAALARTAPAATTRGSAPSPVAVGASAAAMWRGASAARVAAARAITGGSSAPARPSTGLLWPRPARTTGS